MRKTRIKEVQDQRRRENLADEVDITYESVDENEYEEEENQANNN